jgi:predicted esterase
VAPCGGDRAFPDTCLRRPDEGAATQIRSALLAQAPVWVFSGPTCYAFVMLTRAAALALSALLLLSGAARADSDPDAAAPPGPWCSPDVETLSDGMCFFAPSGDELPETLVVFLHGVIKVGTDWQYAQQLALVRFAKQNRFAVLMPRGRVGAGSKKFADHYTWPTAAAAQKTLEPEVIAEWMAAKAELETRNGRPFSRVFVFGFSAGAYYAASLALRGRLPVQGYAVFAGGGAPKHVARWAKGVKPKPPIYVGWGTKDKARSDPQKLAKALADMKWKHRAVGRPRVGHTMTDAQARDAFQFLSRQ